MDANDIIALATKKATESKNGMDSYVPSSALGNNPLARSLLNAYGGLKKASELPQAMGMGADIATILAGAVGGLEQQQAIEPIEAVAPNLADAFPELKGMAAPQAYNLLTKMGGYFAGKARKQEDILDQSDIPAIEFTLKSKGYSDEEIKNIVPATMGQGWGVVKGLASKTRLPRAIKSQEVQFNEFGLPVAYTEYDKLSGGASVRQSPINVKVSEDLSAVNKGKQIIDALYSEMQSFTDDELNRLAASARIGGGAIRFLGKGGLGGQQGEKVAQLEAIINANIPLLARSLGHTGVLTELDVAKSFGIAPSIKLNRRELNYRQELAHNLMAANVKNILGKATPLLNQGIDYDTVANTLGFDKAQITPGKKGVSTKEKTQSKEGSKAEAFSDKAFEEFMKKGK